MYLLLDLNGRVSEIIPDIDPNLPDTSIRCRYAREFIEKLVYVDDTIEIKEGYKFNDTNQSWEYTDPPVIESSYYEEEKSLLDRMAELESENAIIKSRLSEADDISVELCEAIIDIYELMEAMNNG